MSEPAHDDHDDRIAGEVADSIRRSHPQASPAFLRQLVRLHVAQALGQARPARKITNAELAKFFEVDPRRLSEETQTAIQKLRAAWIARHLNSPKTHPHP